MPADPTEMRDFIQSLNRWLPGAEWGDLSRRIDRLTAENERLREALEYEADVIEAQVLDLASYGKGRRAVMENRVSQMRSLARGGDWEPGSWRSIAAIRRRLSSAALSTGGAPAESGAGCPANHGSQCCGFPAACRAALGMAERAPEPEPTPNPEPPARPSTGPMLRGWAGRAEPGSPVPAETTEPRTEGEG